MTPPSEPEGLSQPLPTTPLVADAREMFESWLKCLFWHGDHPEAAPHMAAAFENLAVYYVEQNGGTGITPKAIRIDYHALRLMIGRFSRDVYGVARMHSLLDRLKGSGQVTPEGADTVLQEVGRLGVRINTPKPFLTRRAAVFSLWMCNFRPVHLDYTATARDKRASAFPAALNFFIARSFLELTGTIHLGEGEEKKQRYARILHDFTYREVNLSSLEFFYSGIYRNRDQQAELDGPFFGSPQDMPGWK